MKKILIWMLVISILTACFVAGFFALSVIKEDKEFDQVATEVSTEKENFSSADKSASEPSETPAPQSRQAEKTDNAVSFHPHAIKSTKPSRYIQMTQINVNGETLTDNKKYKAKKEITFEQGKDYTKVDGIISFRGNNFRDNPVFGTADFTKNKLKSTWTYQTGKLTSQGKTWTGSGWTGQPLVVKWPKATKQVMNMYSWAKEDDSLVEVIYACLDGHIYFLDMKTGKQTRDTLNIGYTFKGAGALDPRGYPIMYVGSGYNSSKGKSRVFVISLIDGSVLYTFGDSDPFSLRGSLSFLIPLPWWMRRRTR